MNQKNQNTKDNQLAKIEYPLLVNSLDNGITKLDVIRTYNSLSLKKVVANEFPTIGELQRKHGNEKIEQFSRYLILDLSESFERDLKDSHIEEIAIEINTSILRNLSLEALFVAFQELKKTNVIGKLSISKVLKHLHTFFEMQSELITSNNYNKHLSLSFKEERESEKENKRVHQLMVEGTKSMLKKK